MNPRPATRDGSRSPHGPHSHGGTPGPESSEAILRAFPSRVGPLLALLVLLVPLLPLQAARPVSEYAVKAAFLLNFTRFVEWPTNAFADAKSPLVIGVLGENPFGELLSQTLAGQATQGRPLVLRHLNPGDDTAGCHLLFLGSSVHDSVGSILESLKNSPVVTVGEHERFVDLGGMIGFVLVKDSVRFDINPAVATAARLKLSAKLLAVARSVVKPR